MAYEPLHHKYRPQTFAELVGQEAIATTLTNALRQQKIAPAYLFTGARGTGKTSSARILAKSLNCLKAGKPTETPCGVCDACRTITNGSALDVIEIDAASNTGVDNIRELIERAQFAPVQCRYKVYVVDECLTGDSLVLTRNGWMRIDDPDIVGKQVLSYNDDSAKWEYKPVLRWLQQGIKQTYVIKTTSTTIRCTGNHLIRTEQGWIPASNLQPGMKILSPADYQKTGERFWNLSALSAPAAVEKNWPSQLLPKEPALTTFRATGKSILPGKTTTQFSHWMNACQHWSPFVPSVPVVAESNSISLSTCSPVLDHQALQVSKVIGGDTHTNKSMGSGNVAPKSSLKHLRDSILSFWASSTARCWEMEPSLTQTPIVGFQGYLGLTGYNSANGWSIRRNDLLVCAPISAPWQTKDMENSRSSVAQPATLSSVKCLISFVPRVKAKSSLQNGWPRLRQKDWLGGTWTMVPYLSRPKVAPRFSFIQKATLPTTTSAWSHGSATSVMPLNTEPTAAPPSNTFTWQWEPKPPESGLQTLPLSPFQQWHTNLERVESVRLAGVEPVYDIEVEDNHNFVANGLCVHNCHMLSTQAFNALLKTLEEPPDRVVFVLATTDPQRVLPTIISRCQRFDFRRIELGAMVRHLSKIADQEAIEISPEALQLVAQLAQGGLRDAQSTLDQLSLLEGQITSERVWDLVGAVPERDLLALVQAIVSDDSTAVIDSLRRLMDRGREPLIVLQNLASFYRDLLIAKTSPDRNDLVAITAPTWAEMVSFVQAISLNALLKGQQHLRASELQIKNTTQPRLWLEVTLLGLLPAVLEPTDQSPFSPSRTVPLPPAIKPSAVKPPGTSPIQPPITQSPVTQPSAPISQPSPPAPHHQAPPPAADLPELDLPELDLPELDLPETEPPERDLAEIEMPSTVPSAAQPPQPISQTEPNSESNLEQVWQSILGFIQPPGTQALFKQQGRLLALDATTARIGISSKPLFKMAQLRITNLEAALTQLVEHPIKVSLEVTTLEAIAATTAKSALSNLTELAPNPPNTVSESPAAYQPPSSQPSNQPLTQPRSQPSSKPAVQPNPNPTHSNLPQPWQTEDDVSRAAKSFAQMFNGQIVSDDPTAEPLSPEALTLGPPSLEPELEIEAGDPDEDVPF